MATAVKKDKTLNKHSFRSHTPDQINELLQEKVVELFPGCAADSPEGLPPDTEIKYKYIQFYFKCKQSKKNTPLGKKPVPAKTHLRNAIVLLEMVGANMAVYNGKAFNNLEIKFDIISIYLSSSSRRSLHTGVAQWQSYSQVYSYWYFLMNYN